MSGSVGSYTFDVWRGTPPQLVKQHLTRLTRIGVAGQSAIALAIHGDPFEFESVRYFSTQLAALTEQNNYRSLIGAAPQVVTYGGQNWQTRFAHTYLVEDVQIASLQPQPAFVGPAGTISPAWPVVARWRLIPIA